MAESFTIAVPDERLASIRARIEAFDWDMVPDAGAWQSGVGLADLKRLVDHWLTRCAQERRLNALPQFTADVLGQRLHFIHARGDGSRPPLLLLHGWPGSHHAVSSRGIVRDVNLDVSWSCTRGLGPLPRRHADQGADRYRRIPRSGLSAAAALVGAKDLQHRAMDRNARRRPLRDAGTARPPAHGHAPPVH